LLGYWLARVASAGQWAGGFAAGGSGVADGLGCFFAFSKAKDFVCLLASAYLRLSSIFVITWLADLLYLPRLFVYYCQMGFES